MKFGSVVDPSLIDFSLPEVPKETEQLLSAQGGPLNRVCVGCAKWNRQELKGFYPRGTKDELGYYSTQFNAIELNATFYNLYRSEQIAKWRDKTPEDFYFFPKLPRYVSHLKRLNNYGDYLENYLLGIQAFENKFGMAFLQLHDNFSPKDENFNRLRTFVNQFPSDMPLAIELRHTDWFNEPTISQSLYSLYEKCNMTNVLVDTAGRRDLIHMRLTTSTAFVRYVGANHESDYSRLDDWIELIKKWVDQGLENLYFFIHQNLEVESPLLAAYFIKKLNNSIGTSLKIPHLPGNEANPLGF